MAALAWRCRRAVRLPGLWVVLGHLVAMFPDFLFAAGIPHRRWMDVFLGHLSTHFVPGRNLTWYAVFLGALAGYLAVLAGATPGGRGGAAGRATSLVRSLPGGECQPAVGG